MRCCTRRLAAGALAASFGLWCRVALAAGDLDAEVKDMTWIGFQQLSDASRVFVKTTEPVKFEVDRAHAGAGVIILTLDNTRVPLVNNTRPLDTQYFASSVTSVEARAIEGPSPSVRIEIHTRGNAPFKESQKDTLLALDFSHP